MNDQKIYELMAKTPDNCPARSNRSHSMKLLPPSYRRLLRSLERHLADQAEQREDNAVKAHLTALRASISNPAKRRQGRAEPMPYRLHIAVAFASLASALFSLYWWYPL